MEKLREGLINLFDGMLPLVGDFKRKNYEGIFEENFSKYKDVIEEIVRLCEEKSEEEKDQFMREAASIIPDYAYEKLKSQPKRLQNRLEVDYNMNMAVYVVPMLTYTRDEDCRMFTEHMVNAWNEKQITSLQLSPSTYDMVAGGFRKGILGMCYITTAVCESMDKPDDCYELTTLRNYRDRYLMQTEEGRELVEEYYDTAPFLVQVLNMQKNSDAIYEGIYKDYLGPCIHCIEQNENEECRRIYVDMVRGLQKKYLYS